eukprot:4553455-Prymnesium_polylepis.2
MRFGDVCPLAVCDGARAAISQFSCLDSMLDSLALRAGRHSRCHMWAGQFSFAVGQALCGAAVSLAASIARARRDQTITMYTRPDHLWRTGWERAHSIASREGGATTT